MRFGQGRGGTEKGPSVLRGGLLKSLQSIPNVIVKDIGDCEIPNAVEDLQAEGARVKNSLAVFSGCENLARIAKREADLGRFVLTMGGDHSVAMGSISGILASRPNLGVVWVDAHADINDPSSSPSGNIHGMPVSFLSGLVDPSPFPGAGWLVDAPRLDLSRLVYIGLRDLDPGEREIIRRLKLKAFSMQHIDRYGIAKVMEMTLDHLAKTPCSLHLSFDIDAVDPSLAPSTGTTVKGGLSYREASYLCEEMAASKMLGSMDIVEVNPLLEVDGAQRTVEFAIDLVGSSLGRTILDE